MAAYRIYFVGPGRISARQDFEADEDVAAIRIARVLYDMCSDICQSFELWQGKRQINAQQPHHSRASLTDLIEAHRRVTIDTAEVISESRRMIARSRRLIETLGRIKSKATPTSSNREAPS